jgi:hypothetical protein
LSSLYECLPNSIDWYVQVDFDVPWAKDPFIRAPIELGAS